MNHLWFHSLRLVNSRRKPDVPDSTVSKLYGPEILDYLFVCTCEIIRVCRFEFAEKERLFRGLLERKKKEIRQQLVYQSKDKTYFGDLTTSEFVQSIRTSKVVTEEN